MTTMLAGKRILITGAGSNVGKAAATLFAAHGARLALADVKTEGLAGGEIVIGGDLTRDADCRAMVEKTVAALGGIDVLCCTVGIDPPSAKAVTETSEEDWNRIMAVNVTSVFLTCRAVLPVMQGGGGGSIVTVASQGALLTMPGMAAYGVSKAAVLQLTRQIAADYGKDGIRANAVCPSGLQMPSLDRLGILSGEQLEKRAGFMSKMAPLQRVCSPEDVAQAALWLASDLSGFTTAAAIPVEGGGTAVLRF